MRVFFLLGILVSSLVLADVKTLGPVMGIERTLTVDLAKCGANWKSILSSCVVSQVEPYRPLDVLQSGVDLYPVTVGEKSLNVQIEMVHSPELGLGYLVHVATPNADSLEFDEAQPYITQALLSAAGVAKGVFFSVSTSKK